MFLAAAAVALLFIACGSGQGLSSPTPTPMPAPTATPPRPSPTARPSPILSPTPSPTATPVAEARGFRYPVEGACLPTRPNLLPNAPRSYRRGIHAGIDFYDGLACAPIGKDTPVLAAKRGRVIRTDTEYVEMTAEERDRLLTLSQDQGYTDATALDRFRGRQVWIDHGGGIITRYAHLKGIAPGIDEGVFVAAGEVIGYVGNSGTPEGVADPNANVHLHFEIRIDDSYLGQGLTFDETVAALEQAFSQ